MKSMYVAAAALALLACGCGGPAAAPSSAASSARTIVISSTNTPGPRPSPSGPADPVSTVLTPFATSTPDPSAASVGTPAASASANQVRIQDFSFTPPTLNVTVGSRVTWTNAGPSNHTVSANDGSFDSSTIQRNAAFNFTFSKAGTFAYHCSIHPTMQGTVIVS